MILNMRQWRKAYMLEFLTHDAGTNTDTVNEVFTFSVPPESENFDFPQRVTETPTFGGVVIDDYGNDTVKIRLAGSTVNEEKKLIYRGNKKLPSYYTGEKEIFELQKILEEWGEFNKLPDKKVYLYDLSKMSFIQRKAGSSSQKDLKIKDKELTMESPARNYWRIAIKKLTIKRAKDRPFTFLYDLEAIGIVDKDHRMEPLFGSGFGKVLDALQTGLNVIETVAGVAEFAADAVDTVTQQVVDVWRFVEKMQIAVLHKDWRTITESVLRMQPGGNSLWNSTKAVLSTISKIQFIANEFTALTDRLSDYRSSNYPRDDSFIVSFDCGHGIYIQSQRVPCGKLAAKPGDPALDKHRFDGWFADNAYQEEEFDFETREIDKNLTLYAKWTQTQATVTFNSRQGSAVQPETVDIEQCIEAPTPPTRQGYEFEYWCTDSLAATEFSFSTPIAGDITLYARWKTVYAITFNMGYQSNDGSAVPAQTVGVGGKAIYPIIPERENFIFGIWCSDHNLNTEYNFNSPVNGNLTLYAKWTRISNDVTFDSNGGSAVPAKAVNIGGHAVAPPNPAKEGHTFQRWCSDAGLTQEFLFNSVQVNYPMTLYAKWVMDVYMVQFEGNGGTDTPSQSVSFQGLAVYPPIPAKEGALFLRWCSDEELTAEFDFSTPLTGNITLYADWHGGSGA